MEVGKRIKELRKQEGLTQEKLADYLNISYQAISKWENGTAYPDIKLLGPIATFFGVTIDELFKPIDYNENEEIKNINNQLRKNANAGKVQDNIVLLRKSLAKYIKKLPIFKDIQCMS